MADYFPIRLDVEDDHVGSVLRQLNGMKGIANIHLQLQTSQQAALPPPTKSMNKKIPPMLDGRHNRTSSLRMLIAKALSKGPIHTKIIGEILERNGLSAFSVASSITKMVADKAIVRVGPGTYRLTPQGERRYLNPNGPFGIHKGNISNGPPVNNKKGLRLLILTNLKNKKFSHQELSDLMSDNNYSRNNMYNLVRKLREDGLIRRDKDVYEITDSGVEALGMKTAPQQIEHHGDNS